MARSASLAASLLVALAAPGLAAAAAPEKRPVSVTNASERTAECAVLIDGRVKNYVNIRPGKTWSGDFEVRRELKLVCERSRPMFFGPLKPGATYRIERPDGWFEIAEASGG